MKQLFVPIILIISITSCNKNSIKKNQTTTVENINFKKTIDSIKSTNIYENPKNWEARGLMPSSEPIIIKLRKATDEFLTKLEKIQSSTESYDHKLDQIGKIVDELPWDELDTEEKEFLADTLAPAIKAAGFEPTTIF